MNIEYRRASVDGGNTWMQFNPDEYTWEQVACECVRRTIGIKDYLESLTVRLEGDGQPPRQVLVRVRLEYKVVGLRGVETT